MSLKGEVNWLIICYTSSSDTLRTTKNFVKELTYSSVNKRSTKTIGREVISQKTKFIMHCHVIRTHSIGT